MASSDPGIEAIVVGAGLAGLAAAVELAEAGRRTLVVDQESPANLGGQAHWSFGGLFLVDTPEQRRLGVRDSRALALADWEAFAAFDRDEDAWPRRWAEAYVDVAAGEMRSWLRAQGMRWFPVVGWAERGGNSVPRFHVTWGTGPGVLAPFLRRADAAVANGTLTFRFRHRVDALVREGGALRGIAGAILAGDDAPRGVSTNRTALASFELRAPAVVLAAGGIGGAPELVRANWPARLGAPPRDLVRGVPAHVDGRMLGIAEAAGANWINRDRMWHYTEGVRNWDPIWPEHGIRILPGPSSLWLDATGRRLPAPLFPGFDTLDTLAYLGRRGAQHSWFIANRAIVKREFALSGSEQNPDLTDRDVRRLLRRIGGKNAPEPVEAFLRHGADFAVAGDLAALVAAMNARAPDALLVLDDVAREVEARDRDVVRRFGKDLQVAAIRRARRYLGDRLIRVAAPRPLLHPGDGPLIAVKLHVLTRKTLGGLATDLDGRVLDAGGAPLPGLYAAGEIAGFGGGGMHGYRSLEGSFLGGCIFSGRSAGRALAARL